MRGIENSLVGSIAFALLTTGVHAAPVKLPVNPTLEKLVKKGEPAPPPPESILVGPFVGLESLPNGDVVKALLNRQIAAGLLAGPKPYANVHTYYDLLSEKSVVQAGFNSLTNVSGKDFGESIDHLLGSKADTVQLFLLVTVLRDSEGFLRLEIQRLRREGKGKWVRDRSKSIGGCGMSTQAVLDVVPHAMMKLDEVGEPRALLEATPKPIRFGTDGIPEIAVTSGGTVSLNGCNSGGSTFGTVVTSWTVERVGLGTDTKPVRLVEAGGHELKFTPPSEGRYRACQTVTQVDSPAGTKAIASVTQVDSAASKKAIPSVTQADSPDSTKAKASQCVLITSIQPVSVVVTPGAVIELKKQSQSPPIVTLDGSQSSPTEGGGGRYLWRQISGPKVPFCAKAKGDDQGASKSAGKLAACAELTADLCDTSVCHARVSLPGTYVFELTVSNGLKSESKQVRFLAATPPTVTLVEKPADPFPGVSYRLSTAGSIDRLDKKPAFMWLLTDCKDKKPAPEGGAVLDEAETATPVFRAREPGCYRVVATVVVHRNFEGRDIQQFTEAPTEIVVKDTRNFGAQLGGFLVRGLPMDSRIWFLEPTFLLRLPMWKITASTRGSLYGTLSAVRAELQEPATPRSTFDPGATAGVELRVVNRPLGNVDLGLRVGLAWRSFEMQIGYEATAFGLWRFHPLLYLSLETGFIQIMHRDPTPADRTFYLRNGLALGWAFL